MVELLSMKDFKVTKMKVRLPKIEGEGMKGNLVIVNTFNMHSIEKIVNNPILDDRGVYKFVYRNRNIDFIVKGKHCRLRGTKERAEYYTKCKENLGLTGFVSFGAYQGRNLYYDIYRENELFFNTIPETTAKNVKSSEYIRILRENILLEQYLKDYTNIIMIINLEEWDANIKAVSTKEYDNPINLFYYGMKKEFEDFKTLGNIEILVVTSTATIRFNPTRCDDNSFKLFYKEINKLSNTVIQEEDVGDKTIDAIDNRINLNIGSNEIPDGKGTSLTQDDYTSDNIAAIAKEKEKEHPENTDEENINATLNDPKTAEVIAQKVLEPVEIKKTALSKRDLELREKQKKIKVGNSTLEELFEKKAKTVPIPVNDVSRSVNTLNHEATQVKFDNFADSYNDEIYSRDIASIVYGMQDKSIPVFIRDVEKEDTSDSLNSKETWTIHLEDANRGRHTLKFDVPKFVDGRYMYLNGKIKIFNNQRFLKPLIKTGPDTVQVCTNYNKIFMYRYGDKVESLFEKFKALVAADPKNFSYKRGDCSRLNGEYQTSIEYDTLAKQYAEIVVKTSPQIHLIFSQPKLKEFCEANGLIAEFNAVNDSKDNDAFVAGYYDYGTSAKKRYELYIINSENDQGEVHVKESVEEVFV